ncbi:MAG: Uma2 family endonuclease [Bacteroidetes bacterium]|nr:Uma2 family endonuclease [Bacteroidota bacterium]
MSKFTRMELSTKIFEPERYTYNDYKLWNGDWELVNGYPYAMSPSPKREHQWYNTVFAAEVRFKLKENNVTCNCDVYTELDWIVNDNTVVKPDCMVVCGEFREDYLTFPPQLILEVTSHSTRLRDRNTKFTLYEMYGVKYYLIADCDTKKIEIFELIDNKYKQTDGMQFNLTPSCLFTLDAQSLFP